MRLTRVVIAALALVVAVTAPVGAWSQAPALQDVSEIADRAEAKLPPSDAVQRAPDRVVVSWKNRGSAADATHRHGLREVRSIHGGGASVLHTAGRPVDEVLGELRADATVAWAEPDYLLTVLDEGQAAAVSVNDPLTVQQYALDRMHVREAWSIETGASNVIAVLDTGAWAGHPDLAGRLVAGYDFVNGDSNPADDNAHGTWVSGIIAAKANDGYGIAGISWSDKVMPVKVMDENGTGWTSHLAAGIRWAVDHGASVINMSIGGYANAQVLREAVDYAWAHDVVLVAAAGNNRSAGHVYPASFPHVISVTATQADDEFTNWSNYGADVDVSAPGGSVLTTNCNRTTVSTCKYTGMHIVISGTSFAAPNVAGVVALIRARNPSWANATVVSRLQTTADDLGYAGWDNRYGHGRVNASRALGGTTVAAAASPGDALEANNAFASAKLVTVGTAFRPSIHPASDVDYFAFDVPRAGRLDLTVMPIVDSQRLPKSSLPVDPVLHIYNDDGRLLLHVDDAANSGATERGSIQVPGAARIVLRVNNWFPNGNRAAYSVASAFVDNVAPSVVARSPAVGATGVPFNGAVTVTFSEAVAGVSASTVLLRDGAGQLVPAGVSYDIATRRATLRPSAPLAGEAGYRLTLSSSIKDSVGNALPGQGWSFQTGKADRRLAGADRYATAAAVSAAGFAPGVAMAYVATGTTFPDALAAGPLAARAGGPILLVTHDHIPAATAGELSRLRPNAIVVLGGPGAVSEAVAAGLRGYATGGSLTRLAGADRYATAAAVSAAGFAPGVAMAYVATGTTFPDALAAGPLAARAGGPILLVTHDHIPAATAGELSRLRPNAIVVLGGPGAVSEAVAAGLRGYATGGSLTRLAGADRYATAAAVSAAGWPANGPSTAFLATGATFADALAASPLAGMLQVPLLLTDPASLSDPTSAELLRLDPSEVVVLGSSGAVDDRVIAEIRGLWN
jgi:subtilisin family serine protease/putative cell wall-binding protein